MPSRKASAKAGEVDKFIASLAYAKSPRRIWGRVAQVKGGTNEDRLAFLVDGDLERRNLGERHILPDWITDYSFASLEEDEKEKTDAYVHTDVGPIRLQIKSSEGWREKAEAKFNNKQKQIIALVVVNSSISDHEILGNLVRAVDVIRQRFLEERRGYAD